MLTRQFRRYAPLLTVLLLLVGFTLVMTRIESLGILGLVLLLLVPFVPFLTLGVKPDPIGWNRKPTKTDRSDAAASPAADVETTAAGTEPGAKRRHRDDREGKHVERAGRNA